MMKRETVAIADIYVPVKRRATLDQKRANEIAAASSRRASRRRSWYGPMALTCWLKVYTGWKRPKRLVKRLFSVFWSMRESTNSYATSVSHLGVHQISTRKLMSHSS